jgi:hypothetical protein
VENIEESGRKIKKDIGEEIKEIFLICCNGSLFSNRIYMLFPILVCEGIVRVFFKFHIGWY